jgi:hypothetical protein
MVETELLLLLGDSVFSFIKCCGMVFLHISPVVQWGNFEYRVTAFVVVSILVT